jgi:hypothetical protein
MLRRIMASLTDAHAHEIVFIHVHVLGGLVLVSDLRQGGLEILGLVAEPRAEVFIVRATT